MRLLFDQNLSRHLIRRLGEEFPESRHVTEIGLDTATDEEIWTYAGENDLTIVSKDSDFRQLAFLNGPPPKAVWLRLGNVSTAEIVEVLRANQARMLEFSESVDEALLIVGPPKSADT